MRVLIALDLDDGDLVEAYGYDLRDESFRDGDADDLFLTLKARLEESYAGRFDHPVRGTVVSVGDVTTVLPAFLDSAEIGAEGHPDPTVGGHVLGTIQTMRQYLGEEA